jgi:AcrR family transcriptional regulator
VSHGTVYRHFESKAALRDAVTQRWLDRISAPLEEVAAAPDSAADRLRAWVRMLAATKQGIAGEDPELFATFRQVTADARDVVAAHVDHLAAQLTQIIEAGVATGEFEVRDPAAAGRAVLRATALFHHPAHADEWATPDLADELEAVLDLLLEGLRRRD